MKKIGVFFLFVISLSSSFVRSQCSIEPTILPENPYLCPSSNDTLWTQEYDSYQWYLFGSPVQGATQQFFIYSHFINTSFPVSVEVTEDGCTEMSPEITVEKVYFFPVMYTISSGCSNLVEICTVCLGDSVTLNVDNNSSYLSAKWYANNELITTTNELIYAFTSNEITPVIEYKVEVNTDVCPDDFILSVDKRKIQFVTCENDLSVYDIDDFIQITPNPFTEETTLKLPVFLMNAHLFVYDINGQLVRDHTVFSGKQVVFERGSLANGLYYLTLEQDGKQIAREKLVVIY